MEFHEKKKDTASQISVSIFALVLVVLSRLHFCLPPYSHNIRIAHLKAAVDILSHKYHIILTFQTITCTLVPLLNVPFITSFPSLRKL
jgi:hypothetical protein